MTGATTSRFAYDGLNALAEYNSTNTLQRRWVYDPDGQPILWYEGTGLTNRRFLSADERGSIISTSDSTGAKLAINTYDEYGNPAAANSGRYGYTGQAWLPSVTLWYYKARVYEPQLGRFLQPDPIGYVDTPNLYAYVLNDPVNLVDPLGLDVINCFGWSWCGPQVVTGHAAPPLGGISLGTGGAATPMSSAISKTPSGGRGGTYVSSRPAPLPPGPQTVCDRVAAQSGGTLVGG